MKKPFKILLLTVLLIPGNFQGLLAQINFASNKVKEVYALLPQAAKEQFQMDRQKKTRTNHYKLNVKGQSVEIHVRFNVYKEIEHIGLLLFNEDKSLAEAREVFDYVERSFLISALTKEEYLLESAVVKDDIELKINGLPIKQHRKSSVLPKINIDKNLPLNFKYNSEAFMFEWKLDQNNIFSIKIPNNYSTITGQTKDELEKNFLRKIKNPKIVSIEKTLPNKSQLKLEKGNIYCLPGEIYSTTPELSSAKYYQVTDAIAPVFDKTFYKESIRNLFLNLLNSSLKLKLTQKMYGGTDEKFTININNFYSNFTNEFNIYFGWQNDQKDNLKASVFFSHKIFNYNHLLVINTDSSIVFKKDGEVEGMLMAFIPRETQFVPNFK